jgi:cytochrome P450
MWKTDASLDANDPDTFRADRPNVREHVAFTRGIHSCPGARLARTEGRISVNRILDHAGQLARRAVAKAPQTRRSGATLRLLGTGWQRRRPDDEDVVGCPANRP